MKRSYRILLTIFLISSHSFLCLGNSLINRLKKQNFFSGYVDYLKEKKEFSETGEWTEKEILIAELITEAARPNRDFYNKTILWFKNGNKRVGFRPVDTTTGCDSGCSPLTFHLVLDEKGKTLAILEEKGVPLRKTYHIPLNQKEKEKLLYLCQNFPEKLQLVDQAKDLTDNHSKFPPQTLTFFKDTLIMGGAYTTYQVVSAAMGAKNIIAPDKKKAEQEKKERQALLDIFEQPITDSKAFLKTVDSVYKLLAKTKTTDVKKKIVDNLLQAMYYAVNKDIIAPGKTREETLKFLIKNYLDKLELHLTGAMQSQLYRFLNKLLYSDIGQDFILLLQNNLSFWHKLPENIKIFIPLLIHGQNSNTKELQAHKKYYNDDRFLNYASQNSYFLSCYIKAALALGLKTEGAKAYARLKVKYPKADSLKELTMPKDQEKFIEKAVSQELHNYTRELLREFSLTDASIPKMKGILPFQKDKKIILPTAQDKKQIYLFFAPWCAHCLHLIKTLGQEMDQSFWNKTQLVAVFSEDKDMLQEFIKRSELEKKQPKIVKNLVMIGEDKEAEELYTEKLYLYGVPKAIITNKDGKIINFSAAEKLDPSPEKDTQRDLDLVLSHF